LSAIGGIASEGWALSRKLEAAPMSRDPGLEEKVTFLSRPASYGEGTGPVVAIETHMAWVFLAGQHAYKLKKPVRYEYLDFSTLEARRLACEAELHLNRRLAPAVYLATVPLTIEVEGRLELGAAGRIVDWLVKMRRLPRTAMLDQLITRQAVRAEQVEALGSLLARFYQDAPRVPQAPGAYQRGFIVEIENVCRELCRWGIARAEVDPLAERLRHAAGQLGDQLEQRARENRIVDGHGDLRPEHVCLTAEPAVIDCLEFRADFRIIDAADELAYLGMECDRLGDWSIGPALFAVYGRSTGDYPPAPLIRFYKSFRAGLRAKIAIWHLRDAVVRFPDRWVARTRDYLRLADLELAEAAPDRRPTPTGTDQSGAGQ
jgi:aminoglycoside phosphotransferase family enzyme